MAAYLSTGKHSDPPSDQAFVAEPTAVLVKEFDKIKILQPAGAAEGKRRAVTDLGRVTAKALRAN